MTKQSKQSKPAGRKTGGTRATGVGSNSCIVTSHRVSSLGSTDGSGIESGFQFIDPFASGSATTTVAGIAGSYEFFRIRSCTAEILPSAGSQAVGTITSAFFNGSEIMQKIPTMSDTQREAVIASEQGAMIFSWAAGGVHKYNNSRVTSRKWFHTNVALALTTDDIDRTQQTVWAYSIAGPGSIAVGVRVVFHVTWEFSGLSSSSTWTLANTMSAVERPIVPYFGDTLPKSVTLHSRSGDANYDIVPDKPPPTE